MTGTLESETASPWQLRGSRLSAADDAEADLVELGPAEASAMRTDRSEAMTVVGSFDVLGAAESLGRYLVAGAVLDSNDFSGHRSHSEQTALGLYRVLWIRGGAFWEGAAQHIADEVCRRIMSAPTSGPVHDVWGKGETHTRFLADGWRLLLAEAERRPNEVRWKEAARRAAAMLEGLSTPFGGGKWYLHDSLERSSGHNELVLNTHVQVMGAGLAAGLSLHESARALDAALQRRAPFLRGLPLALGIGAADGGAAVVPQRWDAGPKEVQARIHRAATRQRAVYNYVRGPLGHIARDASGTVPPAYYLTVNLYDLGVLAANTDLLGARNAFRAGVRYGRSSGHFRAEIRSGHSIAALIPVIYGQAGLHSAAKLASLQAQRAGVRATPGWPGYEDRPWRRVRPGSA